MSSLSRKVVSKTGAKKKFQRKASLNTVERGFLFYTDTTMKSCTVMSNHNIDSNLSYKMKFKVFLTIADIQSVLFQVYG